MGEEGQGNLDSFVDIVANTAGIMILLVVMVVIRTAQTGKDVNPDLKRLDQLRGDTQNVRGAIKELGSKKDLQKSLNRNQRLRRDGLAELDLSGADTARLPDMVEKAEAAQAARQEELGKLVAEKEKARLQRDAARSEIARDISEAEIDELLKEDLDGMRSGLVELRGQTAALKKLVGESAARKDQLVKELASLEKEIQVLEAQPGETLEVGGPTAKMARQRRAVWVECFTPEKPVDGEEVSRPCVRLIRDSDVEARGPREKSLRPREAGESTFQILDEASAFRRYVLEQPKVDERTGKDLYMMFVVRPDAYVAFRLARKIAREGEWKVDWRPISAATAAAVPRPPAATPPATAPGATGPALPGGPPSVGQGAGS